MSEMTFTPGPWRMLDTLVGENGEELLSETYNGVEAGSGYLSDDPRTGFSVTGFMRKGDARRMAASLDLLQALEAVEKLFADPGYYIGTRDGADPLAIDATFALVAQAVKAAKGGA